MLISWSQYLFTSPQTPEIFSYFLWCNNCIEIEDAVIHIENSLIKI